MAFIYESFLFIFFFPSKDLNCGRNFTLLLYVIEYNWQRSATIVLIDT